MRRVDRRTMILLSCVLLLSGCARREAPERSTGADADPQPAAAPITGRHTFVIVPSQSKASYHATEEFFPGALRRLGIEAGKAKVVGSTRAVEGQFQLDPQRLGAPVGDNSFVVRLNTLTSDEKRRDDYLREIRDDGGPSFDGYPLASFKATAIDGGSTPNAAGRELNFKLTGDLTVRNMSKRVAFDVKAQLTGDTLKGVGTTQVRLSDFGIGPIDFYDTLTVADEIGIEVEFTAR